MYIMYQHGNNWLIALTQYDCVNVLMTLSGDDIVLIVHWTMSLCQYDNVLKISNASKYDIGKYMCL